MTQELSIALTDKQLHFLDLYFMGHSATDAYITAYDWKGARINASKEAYALLRTPVIEQYMGEVRDARKLELNYTLEDHINKLKIIQGEAMNRLAFNTALKAEDLIAKALGFQKITVKQETNDKKPSLQDFLNNLRAQDGAAG